MSAVKIGAQNDDLKNLTLETLKCAPLRVRSRFDKKDAIELDAVLRKRAGIGGERILDPRRPMFRIFGEVVECPLAFSRAQPAAEFRQHARSQPRVAAKLSSFVLRAQAPAAGFYPALVALACAASLESFSLTRVEKRVVLKRSLRHSCGSLPRGCLRFAGRRLWRRGRGSGRIRN